MFAVPQKNRPAKPKRGHGGIEPPTSPTLKENHTTRPMPHGCKHAVRCARQIHNLDYVQNFFVRRKKKVKGVTGIEPVTSGSAILRSTAELNALKLLFTQSFLFCFPELSFLE